MRRLPMKRFAPVLTTAAVLAGGAISLAQTTRGSEERPRVPQRQLQRTPDTDLRTADSRALRTLIEDLESSAPEEVRSGRIGRFFTDPAVIITNGRMHQLAWSRLRDDRFDDRNRDDRDLEDDRAREDEPDREDDRFGRRPTSARLESFQVRRIDSRTVVAMYTAVLPDRGGVFRQPVVATLIRESSRGWRIASYTAENAAIPGATQRDEVD
jgi:hypothetical protein